MKRVKWSDFRYNATTMAFNRVRFFSYNSAVLYLFHGTCMLVLLVLDGHEWAVVNEGTMLCYALLALLGPDLISRELTDNPIYYGGFVIPGIYGLLVGLLL